MTCSGGYLVQSNMTPDFTTLVNAGSKVTSFEIICFEQSVYMLNRGSFGSSEQNICRLNVAISDELIRVSAII